ncbi:F-box only protein 36-like [Sycon ciliatum]|uniref:F-box only protein 36-like n=1 Tax=Sycon ciliatum TaxID=27933 RepID=UPI0031F62676
MANVMKTGGHSSSTTTDVKRTKQKETVLYEASGQAPAPSKNYYQVLVDENFVTLRWWPISFHLGQHARPGEKRIPLADYADDSRTRDDVKSNLGANVEEKVSRLARGINDLLCNLPQDILVKILGDLDLTSLQRISCCNTYLNEVCSCNALWEKIYLQNHGWASEDLHALASEITWKKVFFMNKLQLQMLLSRRRRAASAGPDSRPQTGGVFLTE